MTTKLFSVCVRAPVKKVRNASLNRSGGKEKRKGAGLPESTSSYRGAQNTYATGNRSTACPKSQEETGIERTGEHVECSRVQRRKDDRKVGDRIRRTHTGQ